MAFDAEKFSKLTQRLDVSDIDFDGFKRQPLPEPALRCLRYMHDIEHHTVCYLRDLLVTRVHRDAAVTTFLTIWNYEEHWHGDAIGRILSAHGEMANGERVATLRKDLGFKDHLKPIMSQVASSVSRHVIAVYMTWGAINEWTTQAAYGRLIQQAANPTLSEILRRIMRQEARHIDFYMSQASERLEGSRFAQRLVRRALSSLWAPVGSGVMEPTDVKFLITYLFNNDEGRSAAARIDRRLGSLPGLGGLSLVSQSIDQFALVC